MPRVIKKVRLVNPSFRKMKPILKKKGLKIGLQLKKALKYTSTTRRKANPRKKLSPLQKLFFGSKRQRSAVAKTLGSKGRKKNPSRIDKFFNSKGTPRSAEWRRQWRWANKSAPSGIRYTSKNGVLSKTIKPVKGYKSSSRLPNVGQILAISPLMNPRSRKKAHKSKTSPNYYLDNRKIRRAVKSNNWEKTKYYEDLARTRSYNKSRRKANPTSVTMARRKASRKRPYGANFIASGPRRKKRLRYAGRSRKGQYKYILNPRRRKAGAKRRKYTRKANPTVVIMRRRNPSRRRRTVARATRRRYSRRRNPGFLPKGGMLMKVGGFFGGVLITNMVRNILPMQFRSGVMGILGTGISAWVASKAIRMVTGNAALANSAFFGGQTVTVVTALKEFAPGVAANLPGLGLIAPSNSLYPQIPVAGAIGPPYDQAVIRGMIPAAPLRGLPAPNVTTRLMRQR